MPSINEIEESIKHIVDSSKLSAEEKAKLLSAVSQPCTPLENDKWIYRIVVGVLGFALIATVIGAITGYLTAQPEPIPDVLIAIGSASVGALAGLLAPSPNSGQ
ncbi:hypothetical protein [Pseudoalteromonas ardens]|uniref:Uncharacterized protein n=1 Tax=Pseudoalteromonas rubra TaxID=43658 RepID=A0A0L0EU00_9GAMM|nr:hypothetical protein [Pseudoalteromonas sp. R96]KNC67860.1 hypothetical protein AC626_08235 [Pseudoalteromonas rubra]MDK1311235.1 hypothetical protein [Pseudoalteromonas sp. R96]